MKLMSCALSVLLATAGSQGIAQDSPPATAPAGAKIVMYRPSAIMGAGLGCPIRYKEREVVELGRGKYAEWNVAPGHYILTNKTASVDIRVDAGETAYVRCQIKPGMLTGRADLQIVDQESFTKHSSDYVRKEIEIEPLANAQ
jgi:hypothetical protein